MQNKLQILIPTGRCRDKFQIFWVIFVVCSFHFAFLDKVFAQEQLNELTIAPPVGYLKIKPGAKARHTVTIQNSGSTALEITPTLVDFKPSEKTGTPILSESLSFPYLDDESKQLAPVTLEPGKRAQLTLNFTVPQFAPDKEYPLTILFSSKPLTALNTNNTGAQVNSIIGSNLIVLVSQQDSLTQKFSIINFTLPKFRDSFSPISIQPIIKNELFNANIASGSATLKNWRGAVVAEFAIYPDSVLGLSERQLRFMPITGVNPEEPPTPQPFFYDSKFLLGPYTFSINVSSSTDIPYSEQFTYSFIAVPYILIGILVLCLILGSGYYWYKNKSSPTF